jgi:Holliday junction resolvase RusA-like endonuclease
MEDDPSSIPYTGRELVNNKPLWEALGANIPDFDLIRDLVKQAYVTQTGDGNPDPQAIASWVRRVVWGSPGFRGLHVERTILRFVMHSDLADKFFLLMQRKCDMCGRFEKFQTIMFFLHTRPVSRQVPTHAAFKKAIADYLRRVKHDFTDFYDARLCVAITFILASGSKAADVDNLAKTLLDALQGYAYRNDDQIDHLDLLRFSSGGEDSFMTIRLAGTDIAKNLDVIWPEFDVRWIPTRGVGPIDLTPYLDNGVSDAS